MNHADDIIRMAREAGMVGMLTRFMLTLDELEHFAALVAAAERETCCKIVYGQCESDNVAQRTVDAIRARGDK
jgi:hypothetical protein